jgi:catechol 2,3-dioxygenase-like lactoylglutathione lyase family enzyme
VFAHVELPVADFERSAAFYRAVLQPLGISQTTDEPPEFGALTLVLEPEPPRLHLAFVAVTREAVEEFHRAGIAAGGRDHGPPGLREYATDYHAAYVLDPDGHNVEAVHRSAETRAGWSWLGIGVVDAR